MQQSQLIELANNLTTMASGVKTGEMTLDELREVFDMLEPTLNQTIEIMEVVIDDREHDEVPAVMRVAIKAEMENQARNFDAEEYRSDVKNILKMMKATDADINSDLFYTFFKDFSLRIVGVMEKVNPIMGNTLREVIEEFESESTTE